MLNSCLVRNRVMAQNQHLPRMYQMEQSVLENIKLFFPDIQITLHDLRNPTPEAVSKFYGAFLEELGANIANLLQVCTLVKVSPPELE